MAEEKRPVAMTAEDLIAFENEIARLFEEGKIRAPVHLCGGNEETLIRVFKDVKPDDWVFSTHRSHLHALLKGIPKEWLKAEILAGHSITINNAEHRFFSSAIVGGVLPIALGVAMAGHTVWCFVGDMASRTGIFHECWQYAQGHNLPIHFVIEDNKFSVKTPTIEVWGELTYCTVDKRQRYEYENKFPHQGSGKWVSF